MVRPRRLLFFVLLLALAAGAFARLGGGSSYSGGSSSSGGGSGDGGGEFVGFLLEVVFRLLFELCIHYPAVGIPLVLAIVAAVVFVDWSGVTSPKTRFDATDTVGARPPPTASAYAGLAGLDANFSRPVFLDLAHNLFVRVHAARGGGDWEPLRPYLSPRLYERLRGGDRLAQPLPPADSVDEIVVGGLVPTRVETGATQRVIVRFDANYVETQAGTAKAFMASELWTLEREAGSLSPSPEVARNLGCPGCGARVQATPEGRCQFCDGPLSTVVGTWRLVAVQVNRRELRPALRETLVGDHQEEGLERRTAFAPDLSAQRRALQERHPQFGWDAFRERVRFMFRELQAGWCAQDPARMRPYETDTLWQAHRLWLERYRREGLANRLEGVEVGDVEVVRVDLDAFYEAVTVRIYARMTDYTEELASGRVVSGSKGGTRRFSEYWTLVRTAGTGEEAGPPGSCPSCGAPLDKVNQAGVCGYCDSEVVSGRFGWVLSWIEQDEEYQA